jgi:glycosyltransferase involved in cell wall biosynthesis
MPDYPLQPGSIGITIVIPCFNYGRFVRRAVDSAMAQQDADVRIVVVDDGSTDGRSPDACRACAADRVRIICQENRGLPAARNTGAAGAATEFLAFLDADDWLEPWFTRELAAAVRAEEAAGRSADLSHAYGQQRMAEMGRGMIWHVPDWDPVLLMATNLHPPTALIRRERFESVGGYDETMREGYEDWDLWLRFAERGWRGVRVRRPVYVWRRHSGGATMISRAVQRHEAIYRRMVESHAAFYERHADALLGLMNGMLRRHDMNWLDESGEPIHRRGLLAQRARYEAMPSVRVHHALHRMIDHLPRPLASGARLGLRAARRLLAGAPGGPGSGDGAAA